MINKQVHSVDVEVSKMHEQFVDCFCDLFKQVDVEVSKMHEQFVDCFCDLFKQEKQLREVYEDFVNGVNAINDRNVSEIRKLFTKGYTPFMVPMDEVDVELTFPLELRIWDNCKLLMVLTEAEIQY